MTVLPQSWADAVMAAGSMLTPPVKAEKEKNQWLFSDDEIEKSPTFYIDHVQPEEVERWRKKHAGALWKIGINLK